MPSTPNHPFASIQLPPSHGITLEAEPGALETALPQREVNTPPARYRCLSGRDARLFGVAAFRNSQTRDPKGCECGAKRPFGCWERNAAQPAAFARLVSIGVRTEGSRTALGERTQPGHLNGGFPCAQFWPVLL